MSESAFSQKMLETLENLIESKVDPTEFSRQLFWLEIEKARQVDEDLADILRLCAIPAFFDAEVIGVLRNRINDPEDNESLLDALTEYHFVLAREDGGYVYHDDIRSGVIADWIKQENSAQYVEIRQRLESFYVTRIQSFIAESRYDEALRDVNRALELSSSNETLFLRALIYFRIGEYGLALNDITRIVREYPRDNDLYFIRGRIYFEQKDFERAIANYNLSIEIEPNNPDYYKWRALAHLAKQNNSKAIEDLNNAVMLSTKDADLYFLRSQIMHSQKRYDEALSDIREAVNIEPASLHYYLLIRRICRDIGTPESYRDAIEATSKAISIAPSDGILFFLRGRILYDLGEFSNALADFLTARQNGYYDEILTLQLTKTYLELRRWKEAQNELADLIKHDSSNPQLLFLRAQTHLHQRHYELALQDIKKAIELALGSDKRVPDDFLVDCYLYLRRIYRDIKDNEAAIDANSEAIHIQPKNAELHYLRGRIYDDIGDYAAALYDWEIAYQLGYFEPYLLRDRSKLYYKVGLFSRALQDAELILEVLQKETRKYTLDIQELQEWRNRIRNRID